MDGQQLLVIVALRDRCRSGAARALRVSAGLSLYDVSKATATNVSTLWRWETGDRQPLASPAALRYADFLEVLADRNRPRRREATPRQPTPA